MFKLPKIKSVLFIFSFFVLLFFPTLVKAVDVTLTYSINDTNVLSGDILSTQDNKGLVKANLPYDNHLFGVVEDEPIAAYKPINPTANDRTVSRNGEVAVNVTDFNGTIKPGDFITASPIAGKGMKATQSGYVIGIATSDITQTGQISYQGKGYNLGQVNVALRIEYTDITVARSTIRLLEYINAALFRSIQDPEKFTLIIRYIIAGIITVSAFVLGFLAFARSVAKGTEAIGRNPLARLSILLSVLMQVVLTLITCTAALVISFIIIRL